MTVSMSSDQIVDAVCADVRLRSGDLAHLIGEAVRQHAPLATSDERSDIGARARARMAGLGVLDALIADPDVDEVLVNGSEVWVDRNGRVEPAGVLDGTTVEQVIERILAPIGRRVDRTSPIVDARLSDGSRVCAVVPPVAVHGAALSIRRFATEVRPLSAFTDDAGAALIRQVVGARCNVVACGPTSSGKTSLLAAMIDQVDPGERIIVLEDTTELPCHVPHVVRLEARPASVDGVSAVSLTDLVTTALRLRPDRLVVGEVRSDECLALVQAMNTGHDGSFSTCHANSPLDALLRLESLVLQAASQWPLSAVRHQLARSIDVIVHVERIAGRRRVTSVCEVVLPVDGGAADIRTLGRLEHDRFIEVAPLSRGRR